MHKFWDIELKIWFLSFKPCHVLNVKDNSASNHHSCEHHDNGGIDIFLINSHIKIASLNMVHSVGQSYTVYGMGGAFHCQVEHHVRDQKKYTFSKLHYQNGSKFDQFFFTSRYPRYLLNYKIT